MKCRRRTTLISLSIGITALYASASWLGAGRLLMPPRKPLQPFQADWLASPRASGMRIEPGTTAHGVPYLMCVPDAAAGPGTRGGILRRQLTAAHVPLRPFGQVFGTVVLMHGWGMRKEDLLSTAERFCAAGLRCLVPDLPGHGANPVDRADFGMDAVERRLPGEVLDSAAAKFLFPRQPAALWGMSMGGAYAIQAAGAQPERWNALIVVSSFDALEPVVNGALNGFAWGLSALMDPGLTVAVRCRGGFWLGSVRPVESARQLAMPTFILHGTADALIPIGDGRALFQAIPHPRKQWLEVTDGHHGNVLGTPQHVFVEMASWYARWLPQPIPGQRAASPRKSVVHQAEPEHLMTRQANTLISGAYDAAGGLRR